MTHLIKLAWVAAFIFSLNALAAFDKTTACKDMNIIIWQKNWAGCMRALKNAINAKAIDANWANTSCDCMTDELINKTSCEDLTRFERDEKFAKESNAKITAICQNKVPLKKTR